MLFLRRALVFLRNEYLYKRQRLLIIAGGATLFLSSLTFLMDFLLPFEGLGMLLRTLILIPTSLAMFTLGYALVLAYTFLKAKNPEWTPLRSRYSPTWRQRIAMIVGAVLFVLVYATVKQPGYTFTSSLIVASVIGLFAFIRKTSFEINREELGIPDARDAALNTHLRRHSAASRVEAAKPKTDKQRAKVEAKAARAREKLAEIEAELE